MRGRRQCSHYVCHNEPWKNSQARRRLMEMPLMVARSRNFVASSSRVPRRPLAIDGRRLPPTRANFSTSFRNEYTARWRGSMRSIRRFGCQIFIFHARFFLQLPPHRHSKPSSAINGTEITTVAPRVPLKTRDHRTVPATKYVSLTIFFVRGRVILHSLKDASFVPSARR